MQTLTYVIGKDRRALVDNVQNFTIDFNDAGIKNWVQARQYERGMRQVFVNIKYEDGTPLDLTGCNVWFEGYLPKSAAGDFRWNSREVPFWYARPRLYSCWAVSSGFLSNY